MAPPGEGRRNRHARSVTRIVDVCPVDPGSARGHVTSSRGSASPVVSIARRPRSKRPRERSVLIATKRRHIDLCRVWATGCRTFRR